MNYRVLWGSALAGLLVQMVGMVIDAKDHSTASHLAILAGLGLTVGSLIWAGSSWAAARSEGVRRTLFAAGGAPIALGVAAAAVFFGSDALDRPAPDGPTVQVVAELDHSHGAPVDASADQAAGAAETHSHPAVATSAEDAAAESMGEANAHTHGTEVSVSAAQLQAAGAFVAELKAHTAPYQDIRAAMADGYVQITQDLPGIAAHFIKLDFQHDGHEMDPDRPEVLLYTKRLDGQWRLVGVMMLQEQVTEEAPSYFGSLDSWHYHSNLCFTAAAVRVTETAGDCKNGLFVPRTPWQMHVWLTGQDDAVFAHDYAPISPGAFPGATKPAADDFRVQAR